MDDKTKKDSKEINSVSILDNIKLLKNGGKTNDNDDVQQ